MSDFVVALPGTDEVRVTIDPRIPAGVIGLGGRWFRIADMVEIRLPLIKFNLKAVVT